MRGLDDVALAHPDLLRAHLVGDGVGHMGLDGEHQIHGIRVHRQDQTAVVVGAQGGIGLVGRGGNVGDPGGYHLAVGHQLVASTNAFTLS